MPSSILSFPTKFIGMFREQRAESITFPLFHLPKNVTMEVLRNMSLYEKCALSLCSKVTRALIKSLNIKNITLLIDIEFMSTLSVIENIPDSYVDLMFQYDKKKTWRTARTDPIRTLTGNVFIYVEHGRLGARKKEDWTGFSKFNGVREWIIHFRDVFNLLEVDILSMREDEIELNSIKECMDGITFTKLFVCRDRLMNTMRVEYFDEAVLQFFPRYQFEMMNGDRGRGDLSQIKPEILVQNICLLEASFDFKTTLNDLLMANGEYMEFSGVHLSEKDINRFLKLWVLGCNPRMKYLLLQGNQFENMEILKDIKFKPIPEDSRREFPKLPTSFYRIREEIIKGGFEIKRNDGTMATVHFGNRGLQFFVWD